MLPVNQTVRAGSRSLLLIWRQDERLLIFVMMEVFNCKLRLIISTESFGEVVFQILQIIALVKGVNKRGRYETQHIPLHHECSGRMELSCTVA